MPKTNRFNIAKKMAEEVIATSKNPIDLSHAENTLYWLRVLYPDADEIVCLAAYMHDIERANPDHLNKEDFSDYTLYKRLHAQRSGELASTMIKSAGYTEKDSLRLARIIENAEFFSNDRDVQSVCDADSVSFFDNNIEQYLKVNNPNRSEEKIRFMYDRASVKAKLAIDEILAKKSVLKSMVGKSN